MRKRSAFFLVLLVLAVDVYSQGCSQCKLLAEQNSGLDESAFSSNMNFGILYLMLFPYLILIFLFRKQLLRLIKSFKGQSSAQ